MKTRPQIVAFVSVSLLFLFSQPSHADNVIIDRPPGFQTNVGDRYSNDARDIDRSGGLSNYGALFFNSFDNGGLNRNQVGRDGRSATKVVVDYLAAEEFSTIAVEFSDVNSEFGLIDQPNPLDVNEPPADAALAALIELEPTLNLSDPKFANRRMFQTTK